MTDVLYAAKGGSSNSDLYTVDSSTGGMTSVGPIGFAVTGLAIDPTSGTLYGMTSNNSPTHSRSLITIDKITGAGSFVAAVSPSSQVPDICFDSSGQMYGWLFGPTELSTIDKATGAAVRLGVSGIDPALNKFGMGLDFVSGTLFSCPVGGPSSVSTGLGSYGTLFSLDPVTGAAGNVALMSGWAPNDGPSVAACATDGSGVFWAIFNQFPACSLVKINTVTGVVTTVGSMLTGSDALVWSIPLPPNPVDDSFSMIENRVLNVPAPGVLGNDIDPTTASLNTGPTNGTLVLNADGSFIYTPNTDFIGVDTFTYNGNGGTATVTINVVNATARAKFDGKAVYRTPLGSLATPSTGPAVRARFDGAPAYRTFQ